MDLAQNRLGILEMQHSEVYGDTIEIAIGEGKIAGVGLYEFDLGVKPSGLPQHGP